ncbi:hypothetical protein SAMN02745945_02101 [Peptoclostridium litorale DSM 5388]|uniref:Uncharacterized protein n=2 Tax=Peptoclostridium litorale TaxID=1557 RepID=A0A069REF5_PEPLI|nr:hypothetical protein [Peptoclostridium litorale]KDR95454.1 hypothetical protein CLIT_10c01810 [Peptoclostridium litorale DSM 5388]SIO18384.1 hypothetical protein SAMN02745945_02101 [Peptoclostridium litorale DSM 5388]
MFSWARPYLEIHKDVRRDYTGKYNQYRDLVKLGCHEEKENCRTSIEGIGIGDTGIFNVPSINSTAKFKE